MADPIPPRRVSITISIFAAMLAIATVLAGALIIYGFQRNRDAALLAADARMVQTGRMVRERAEGLVQPLAGIAGTAAVLPEIGREPDLLGHPLQGLFLQLLQLHPHISSIYLGYENGDFYQALSLLEERPDVREVLRAPPAARFAIRSILRRGDGGRVEIWKFLDDGLRAAGSRIRRPATFDPRTRPWFEEALASDDVIRTEPYPFATRGEVGMTLARRFDAQVAGVLGIDLTLASLSAFLREQKLSDDDALFIFRDDGTIVADADASATITTTAGGLALARASEGDNPLIAATYAAYQAGEGRLPGSITVDGRRYVARAEALPSDFGRHEMLAVVVPVEVFTAQIATIGRQSALVSIAIGIATLPLIFLLSRRISHPLQRLAHEAEEIRAFRLDEPIRLESRIEEVSRLAAAMDRMKAGLRTFGLYVPKALVRRLMEAGSEPALGGERREITLLFTDVAGFTDFSETVPPEALMQRVSVYFEELTQALMAEGATIDKFMGDAIMAFWNAPLADVDHAAHACLAALLAREANRQLNERWQSEGLPAMTTRFGLHTGIAVVGNVGSSDRMNYTAIGADVNLASRLEGLNKHYGTTILVSGAVAERVRGRFLLRPVDKVIPKGIAEPLAIHELLATASEGGEVPDKVRVTAGLRARCGRWEEAYTMYLERRWAEALASFRSLAEAMPDDALARLYVARAERLLAEPPGPEWAGVSTFETK